MKVTTPFHVPVAGLLRDLGTSSSVSFVAPFDEAHEFEPRAYGDSDVPLNADVTVMVRLESFRGGLRVRGRVEAPWQGICRRCSTPIDGFLTVTVNERYVENPAPEDEEAYPFDGDVIDLLPLVHDAVLLELPIAPLCRPDCQGLCSICGADWNEGRCTCAVERDPRWATLDALRFEDDASE